ncbi:uncharacterized protein LOC144139896 [Haemaphysalis longicornis]
MNRFQIGRLAVMLQIISSSSGPLSLCSNVDLTNPTVLVPIIAVCECRSRVLGWHLRIGQCPQEVETLCGWLPPSSRHWKRMTKTLRSESWRQVRHFTDCMKVACTTNGLVNVKDFREWLRQANNLTEAFWNYARPNLPKKQKKVGSEGRLLALGDANVDERQQKVLKLGPKFCIEPRLDIVDRLALTRDVARYVLEKEKDRCLVECVDVVAKARVRTRTKPSALAVEENAALVDARSTPPDAGVDDRRMVALEGAERVDTGDPASSLKATAPPVPPVSPPTPSMVACKKRPQRGSKTKGAWCLVHPSDI